MQAVHRHLGNGTGHNAFDREGCMFEASCNTKLFLQKDPTAVRDLRKSLQKTCIKLELLNNWGFQDEDLEVGFADGKTGSP